MSAAQLVLWVLTEPREAVVAVIMAVPLLMLGGLLWSLATGAIERGHR